MAKITLNAFINGARRTQPSLNTNDARIYAALGLAGETGEIVDLIKKTYYHGHAEDDARLVEELGDVLWYAVLLADALGVTLQEVFAVNQEKLKKRYPEGFSAERSRQREENA